MYRPDPTKNRLISRGKKGGKQLEHEKELKLIKMSDVDVTEITKKNTK